MEGRKERWRERRRESEKKRLKDQSLLFHNGFISSSSSNLFLKGNLIPSKGRDLFPALFAFHFQRRDVIACQ